MLPAVQKLYFIIVALFEYSYLLQKDQIIFKARAGVVSPKYVTTILKFHKICFNDLCYKHNRKCCNALGKLLILLI